MSIRGDKFAYLRALPLAELEHERREMLNNVVDFYSCAQRNRDALYQELQAYKDLVKYKMRSGEQDTSITFKCNAHAKLFLHTLAKERGVTVSEAIIEIISEKLVENRVDREEKERLKKLFAKPEPEDDLPF